MNFLDGVTENVDYEFINRNIIGGFVMSIFFFITKVNYGSIDADDTSCHGFYIIRFSSYIYSLQVDKDVYVQVVSYS